MKSMSVRYYALHDWDPARKRKGAFEICESDIKRYNEDGYGIFWTVNDYDGARKSVNITRINYWCVDIDDGTKQQQMSLINGLLLKPSVIVESNKGYHCYWRCLGGGVIDDYRSIVRGLIGKLNGDCHCVDPVRLLRVPYTYHQKDKSRPFLIQVVEESSKSYTNDQMKYVYEEKKKVVHKAAVVADKQHFLDSKNWQRLFKVDQIGEGSRNATLARYVFWLKDIGLADSARYIINGINERIAKPLPQWEVDAILRSKGV